MVSVPLATLLVGVVEACSAGGPDGVATAVAFVVGGAVADPFMEPDGVVVLANPVEFSDEGGGVGDGHQVRVLVFDVSPESFDR